MKKIARIVSGGQSGVDRAALDVALKLNIKITGWVPKDGWAEDFTVSPGLLEKYPEMKDSNDDDVAYRTRLNVRDSHATLIIIPEKYDDSKGTNLTVNTAQRYKRSYYISDLNDQDKVLKWIDSLPNELILNIAGPRESEMPGIYDETYKFLLEILTEIKSKHN